MTLVLKELSKRAHRQNGAGMGTVHNHSWVTFALLDAFFVEGERCLLEVRVAIDLNLQAVVGILSAHIAALIVDDNAKLWVIFVNQRHGAWFWTAI